MQGNGNNWFCAENTATIPAATSTGTQLFTSPSGNTAIYHVIIAPVVAAGGALYSDDFNRADGALTTPWVQIDSTHSIVSSKVPVGPGSPTTSYYNQTFAADQWAEADLTGEGAPSAICPIVRCDTR